jgi:hypothetical protein
MQHCRLWLLLIAFLLQGCASSSMLPSAQVETITPWQSFDEAKAAFDRIEPNRSTLRDIRALGFDPHLTANIQILTYVDIINRFRPTQAIGKEDLAPAIRQCLEVKDECRAFEVKSSNIHRQRYGNVLADLFSFRRRTRETGWQFEALIVMDDGLVIYKLYGGKPTIENYEDRKNPLGPLQSTESLMLNLLVN